MVEVSLSTFICQDLTKVLSAVYGSANPLCAQLNKAQAKDTVVVGRQGKTLQLDVTTPKGHRTLFMDGANLYEEDLLGARHKVFSIPFGIFLLFEGALFGVPAANHDVPKGRSGRIDLRGQYRDDPESPEEVAIKRSAVTYLRCRAAQPQQSCEAEHAAIGSAIQALAQLRAAETARREAEGRDWGIKSTFAKAQAIWEKVDVFFVAARKADNKDSDLDQLVAVFDRYASTRPNRHSTTAEDAELQLRNAERMLEALTSHPSFRAFVLEEGQCESYPGNSLVCPDGTPGYRYSKACRLPGLEGRKWNKFEVEGGPAGDSCPKPKPEPREPRTP